jgi:hypothetical protein
MDPPESPVGTQEGRSREGASKRKRSPSDWRRKERRLAQQAIERASNARRDARGRGDFHAAHELDLDLHGEDPERETEDILDGVRLRGAGVTRRKEEESRAAYGVSYGGLYAEKRAGTR